jgi:hypothetical protein
MWDNVLVNEGGGFDENTGIFTTPTSGLYVITWTSLTQAGDQFPLRLMIDWKSGFAYTFADARGQIGYDQASNLGILPLSRGSTVMVQTNIASQFLNGNHYTSFAGWMIKRQ